MRSPVKLTKKAARIWQRKTRALQATGLLDSAAAQAALLQYCMLWGRYLEIKSGKNVTTTLILAMLDRINMALSEKG